MTIEDLTQEQCQELVTLVKQRVDHQRRAVQRFAVTLFSNVGQSVSYLSLQLHWSTLVAPALLAMKGSYKAYADCREQVRVVDTQLQALFQRVGEHYQQVHSQTPS